MVPQSDWNGVVGGDTVSVGYTVCSDSVDQISGCSLGQLTEGSLQNLGISKE